MRQPYLFANDDLDERLRNGTQGAGTAVNEISEQQFLASSDDEITEHVKANWIVQPIVLDEAAARMDKSETKVDVSRDPNRFFSGDHAGPFYIPGTQVLIRIPYTGAAWLWQCRTNPFAMNYPVGTIVKSGTLELSITLAHDAPPERFKQLYDENLGSIRTFIQRGTAQIVDYNQKLDGVVRAAVAQRRERLKQHDGIAAILNIPLQEKAGAPPIQRIPLEIRKPPPLPVPPKGGLQPEPGINEADYEKILNVIRHEGRTFETTPRTYAKLDEEELRDVLLAHLNGHFQGAAAGETFRRKGKTDIRIEDKERSAFVAECKVWSGAGEVPKALEQMLGYITWRDSKAALVFFNKSVAGFSELPARLHEAISKHAYVISESKTGSLGEYRFLMRSAEDEGRRVTVHVFLFNLYWKS